MKNFYPSIRNILSPGQIRLVLAGMAAAFVMAILPGKLEAQAPAFTYSTPQTYAATVAISSLSPVSTGGAVPAFGFNTTPTDIQSGVTDATSIALDKSGNMYIGEGSGNISFLPAGGSTATTFATGFGVIWSVALDASNNVYAADGAHVWKIPAGGGTAVSLGSFTSPIGLAFDASGYLYVAVNGGGSPGVYKMNADGAGQTRIDNNLQGPAYIAFDTQGNLFIGDQGTSALYEIPAGGTQKQLASGLQIIISLATDPAGNVYVEGRPAGIFCYSPSSGLVNIDPISTYGIMTDANFNLYYCTDGHISKISPNGGYFVSPELPSGLTINPTTGVISGTPSAASPAANYTVTAFNATGKGTATVNIMVGPMPPPAISYSTPQTYTAGTAITPLSPVNAGGAVPSFGYNPATIVNTGVSDPVCMVKDNSGNMYIGENSGRISVLAAGASAATILATGFGPVNQVALDGSNNVYLADGAHIWKIPAGGGTPVTLGSFSSPVSVAVGPDGNLYVGDKNYADGLYQVSPTGSVLGRLQTSESPGVGSPTNLAFDGSGNLVVADNYWTVLLAGQAVPGFTLNVYTNGLSGISFLAIDPSGNIFLSDNNGIQRYTPGNRSLITITSVSADGLMTDANFNLYYADGHNIYKMSLNGYQSLALPSGLSVDANSGVISGTPTGASPAADYHITAFNANGSGTATVNITVNPALPSVSYSSPKSYQVGTAIAALSPSSSRVASWSYSASTNLVSSGLGAPVDVAADAAGNVYAVEFNTNQVVKIPAGGGAAVVLGSGFSGPFGVAVDAAGNVYVADAGNNAVKEILAGTSTINTIGSGFNGPSAVTVDGSGNVYVGDTGNGALKEIPVGGGAPVTLQSGFASIQGVATDPAGNVYVADAGVSVSGGGAVYKVPAGGGSMVSVGTGFSRPSGVAVDAAGNLYVSDVNQAVITVIEPGGTQLTVGSGFNHSNGIAFDSGGNLYIADSGNGMVKEAKITGGYFLTPFLPAGLSFDNNTGTISGTPAALSPTASYSITGWNITGSATATVSITVGAPIISYTSPVAYPTGAAITPLTPSVAGGAVPAPAFSTTTTLATGLADATCLAIGPDGSIYVGELSGQVSKLAAGNSATTVFATGFSTSNLNEGIAVDPSGNVYFADGIAVWKIPAGGGTATTLGSFTGPTAVALDAAGNIYVADAGAAPNGGVYKMAPDGTGKTTIINAAQSSITLDHNGNLFSAFNGTNVSEVPAGGVITNFHFFSQNVKGISTDLSGNFYALTRDNLITMLPANGSGTVQVLTGSGTTTGIASDANFNVYTVVGGNIVKANAAGGYFISPELPPGLTINPNTGAISGTPTAASPTTNYTVKAFNTAASATAAVNITVGPAPAISYSTPPVFTAGTAITPLLPQSTGAAVAAPAFNATTVTLNTGITDATCTAMDKSGNLYIGESSGKVSVLAPGSIAATVFATGFLATTANGIAVDASGNVYFADEEFVWKIPAGGGTAVKLGNIADPTQVSTDAAGNLYVHSDHGIYKMASDGTNQTLLINGFVSTMAVDQNGNVFFSSRGSQAKLFEIPAGGTQKTVNPNGGRLFTTDPSGNIYMVNGDGSISMVPANGTIESQVESFIGSISSIMVGPDFNLYAVVSGRIVKAGTAGGYFISPELPLGLNIDPTSGAISGTPAVVLSGTDYTVTAFSSSVGASTTVNITVNPSAPVISYSTPQVFVQNSAISPLSPVSVYVAAPAYLNTATTAGSFAQPFATAVDQNGNVYVADKSANNIYELLAGGGQVTVGTGLNTPAAVAVDKLGNVYTANQGDNTVVEIQAHSGTQTFVGSGYQRPTAVAVDSSGNVFVADVQGAAGVVYKIRPGQNKQLFKRGFISPNGIAVDAAGNVYVSDFGGGATASMVYEISPNGNTKTPINHSFATATGLAIDATGNLFIVDAGNTDIVEYPAGGGPAITLAAGLTFPFGLSADGAGNLYVADPGAGQVVKLAPAGGYFINRALPAGLSVNAATGVISGTPTLASAPTNYTVTAYGEEGSGTATVNIKVSSINAGLAKLSLNPGILSPVFATGVNSYTAGVKNGVGSTTVTPTTTDPNATVTVNGTAVTSGSASGPIRLNVGANTINVKVTAQDGITTQTYTVTVTRAGAPIDGLSGLLLSAGIKNPIFQTSVTTYTASVANAVSSITVTPTTVDPNATVKVDGITVASGTPSGPEPLNVGPNAITITVTAQDGSTTKTYTLTVTRAGSTNANLSSLKFNPGQITPVFTSAVTSYTANVVNAVSSTIVTPTTADPNATITVNGIAAESGSPTAPITLNVGPNTITTQVTAQDGSTTKTYTVIVTRAGAPDALLTSLKLSAGTKVPVFGSSTFSYTEDVSHGVSTITVTPTAKDPDATIMVNNATVASGATSDPLPLNVGSNTITIDVTASDGLTQKSYVVIVTRAAPPADNTAYQPIGVEKPAETPALNDDGIVVHPAISPNGDGINDFLQIDNISQYPDNKLSIMNRNGQLVFEASGYDNSSKVFDGHSNKNGQMQLPGTYFYQLNYMVSGIAKHKTGFIILKY